MVNMEEILFIRVAKTPSAFRLANLGVDSHVTETPGQGLQKLGIKEDFSKHFKW